MAKKVDPFEQAASLDETEFLAEIEARLKSISDKVTDANNLLQETLKERQDIRFIVKLRRSKIEDEVKS